MNATIVLSRRATIAALAFGALAMPAVNSPALADGTSGVYAIVSGAVVWRVPAGEDPTTYIHFAAGDGVNIAVGYQFNKRIGADFEYTHTINWAQTVAATATGPAPGLGNVSLDFKMLNGRYEVPMAGPFAPYVSVGVGEYESHLNGITNTIASAFGLTVNGTNTGETLAYQARAGVMFKAAKNVQLLLGYRFLRGGNLVFNNTAFGTLTPNGATLNQIELGAKFGPFSLGH
jgi:opacity protein-like surface antigen